MKKIFLIALLLLVSISSVHGYETDTHAYFTEEILSSGKLSGEILQDKYLSKVIEGSKYEDEEKYMGATQLKFYDSCPFIGHPYCNHFMNPNTGKGLKVLGKQFSSAYDRAFKLWKFAKWSYNNGNKEDAYFNLGRVAHLLQDMGVPEHTNLVEHSNLCVKKGEYYYPYESYVKNIQNDYSVGYPSNYNNLRDIFYGLAKKSYQQNVIKYPCFDEYGNSKVKYNGFREFRYRVPIKSTEYNKLNRDVVDVANVLVPETMKHTINLLKLFEKEKMTVKQIGRGDSDYEEYSNYGTINNLNGNNQNEKIIVCKSKWLKTYDSNGKLLMSGYCWHGCNPQLKKCNQKLKQETKTGKSNWWQKIW
jgi:hypothetical protein